MGALRHELSPHGVIVLGHGPSFDFFHAFPEAAAHAAVDRSTMPGLAFLRLAMLGQIRQPILRCVSDGSQQTQVGRYDVD